MYSYFTLLNLSFVENSHICIITTFAKQSMINRLSNPINRNRSAAKILKVMSSSVQAPGSLHGAVLCPTTAVAARVERSLNWQLALQEFGVVPGDDAPQIGHSAV